MGGEQPGDVARFDQHHAEARRQLAAIVDRTRATLERYDGDRATVTALLAMEMCRDGFTWDVVCGIAVTAVVELAADGRDGAP